MPYPAEVKVRRASLREVDIAYNIVSEYYEEIGVVARDDKPAFERDYFAEDAGIWLAMIDGYAAGCIGLRRLPKLRDSGEIKRLYVRIGYRGQGVAEALLKALEVHALNHDYKTLYLDSKKDLMPAIRFYRRHGYEPCERYNDNPQATIFMRKHLVQCKSGI